MEDQPEAHVARHSPDDGIACRHRNRAACDRADENRGQQSRPEQRQGNAIGQQLMVNIDAGKRDQGPGDQQRTGCRGAEAKVPGYPRREQTGRQFYQGIARGDPGLAGGAASAQQQPAHHRDVLPGPDGRLAGGAGGAGSAQGKSFGDSLDR